MPGIIVDIGTGDGKFTYELSKANSDRFIIGIDPSLESLREVSGKIYKKLQKGGLPNALFVLARIEELPIELAGMANQVFINLPWSGLLKSIVAVENAPWDNIKRICALGAYVDLVFGYAEAYDQKKMDELALPELSLEYLKEHMAPKLEEKGFVVLECRELDMDELNEIPSTWAKKLAFGRERKYFYVQLQLINQ